MNPKDKKNKNMIKYFGNICSPGPDDDESLAVTPDSQLKLKQNYDLIHETQQNGIVSELLKLDSEI